MSKRHSSELTNVDCQADRLFGQIALDKEMLQVRDLDKAIHRQNMKLTADQGKNLGQILVEMGVLSDTQVSAVLRAQDFLELKKENKLYGKIAVKNNFVSNMQVRDCLEEQKTLYLNGNKVPLIGEMFLSKGLIDDQQNQAILSVQDRLRVKEQEKGRVERAEADTLLVGPPSPQQVENASAQTIIDATDGNLSSPAESPTTTQPKIRDGQLGAILVSKQIISMEQLNRALDKQELLSHQGKPVKLGQVLVSQGAVTQERMEAILERQLEDRWDHMIEGHDTGKSKGKSRSKSKGNTSLDDIRTSMMEITGTGSVIAQCRIKKQVGSGAMGVVYQAVQLNLDREVAVKILPPTIAKENHRVQRFIREAKTIARVNHPNIVQIYDSGIENDIPYLVMEFIEGKSLEEWMEERRKVSIYEAVEITRQVALGLEAASKIGLVHRDIKPANILISNKGEVKVADFGLAKIRGESTNITQSGMIVGTPLYMAPEQSMASPVDIRSDIYSLGATLFHLLTNRPPFHGKLMYLINAHQTEAPPMPRRFNPQIPNSLEKVVLKMLAKNPRHRHQTPQELVEELEKVDIGQTVEDLPVGASGFKIFLMIIGLCALMVGGGAAGLYYYPQFSAWLESMANPDPTPQPKEKSHSPTDKAKTPPAKKTDNPATRGKKTNTKKADKKVTSPKKSNPKPTVPPIKKGPKKVVKTPIPKTPPPGPSDKEKKYQAQLEALKTMAVNGQTQEVYDEAVKMADKMRNDYPEYWGHLTNWIKHIRYLKSGMAYIPPGKYRRGHSQIPNASPPKVVTTKGYYIDILPVTNRDYHQFLKANSHIKKIPFHWNPSTRAPSVGTEDQPVTNITQAQAQRYAQWKHKRLPTEIEWERAALGSHSPEIYRLYPWGNKWDNKRCNGKGTKDGYEELAPVEVFPGNASYYKVRDMAGNIMEWTSSPYRRYANSNHQDFKYTMGWTVVRGSSYEMEKDEARGAIRRSRSPTSGSPVVGFRCVVDGIW